MKHPAKKKHQHADVEEKQNKIKRMADKMCELLIKEGFTIQRYEAYSTNSIYLKLDYGMCNSIRISDHEGKKHLSYKYNLRCDINHDYRTNIQYTRYYVSFKHYKRLVEHIKIDRWKKYNKAGSIAAYNETMKIERNLNKNNLGFWQKAYVVS